MTNRRQFLRNASIVAATGVLAANSNLSAAVSANQKASKPKANASKVNKSFGLQIYSLTVAERQGDREFSNDVPGGLKRVAAMGYTTIELAGYNMEGKIGAVPMPEFKKYADDAGLKIVSSHLNPPYREYSKDNLEGIKDFWKKAADRHAAIGCKYIIQPGEPVMRNTEEVAFVGQVFNEAGKIAKAAGLIFGYHNHSGEYVRVVPRGREALPADWRWGKFPEGAKMVYDGMIEATDPSLVIFENDVYWTVMGQQDPVAYMKKYADRIRVLHIKDVTVLGKSGMMNFQKIFETAYANGIQDFFVELEENNGRPQFEGVKGCADYLLKADFVK